jgi:hypothetical protein
MIALLAATAAEAATTIAVTSTADTSTTACVLRDAISVANAGGGAVNGCAAITDTAFTIDFQSGLTGTITLGSALPTITGNLTINGPTTAPGITIDGNNAYRVLFVSGGTLSINDLTIANGNPAGGGGGGIFLDNAGILTVTNSTFSGNSGKFGGGINIQDDSTLTVTNSTFSGNTAAAGGGIYSQSGTVTVTNSTFFGNRAVATNGGGIGIFSGGTLNLKGTILADSTGANCGSFFDSTINDIGYNIADDDSCNFTTTTSQVITPTSAIGLASALAQNGGPTQTIALNGTPANTFIPAADCTDQSRDPLTTDQRGFVRPVNGTCSAGAYQYASALPIDCSTAFASNPNLTAVLPVFASEYVFGVSNQARPYNLQITGVTQDKPVPGFPLCPNAFWTSTTTYVRVTNEPLQPGPSGLLYQIQFTATDTGTGASCSGEVPACVQGILNSGKACLASLESYDATKCP